MREEQNELNVPATVYETATSHAWAVRPETLQEDHQRIADGLADEDANSGEIRHLKNYRGHSDWREMADAFEAVMRERGIPFTPIRW
jgi:hypothetical protein